MSITIQRFRCTGCGRCVEACPGNLIKMRGGRAYISREKDCWGCTSCLKECQFRAISFFLGADIGGCGLKLYVEDKGAQRSWIIVFPDGSEKRILINRKESNRY